MVCGCSLARDSTSVQWIVLALEVTVHKVTALVEVFEVEAATTGVVLLFSSSSFESFNPTPPLPPLPLIAFIVGGHLVSANSRVGS